MRFSDKNKIAGGGKALSGPELTPGNVKNVTRWPLNMDIVHGRNMLSYNMKKESGRL